MGLHSLHIVGAVFVGTGAALLMDLWNLFLWRALNISSLSYCFVGRWLSSMLTGTFSHSNIVAAPKRPAECVIGWTAHFLIGITFALMLVISTAGSWLEHPALLPAMLVGMGTVIIPYFIVQPALGLGIGSANTRNPTQARLKSLMTHTAFGVGLYLSGVLWSFLMHAWMKLERLLRLPLAKGARFDDFAVSSTFHTLDVGSSHPIRRHSSRWIHAKRDQCLTHPTGTDGVDPDAARQF